MTQTQKQNHSIQQSSTEVETNNFGHPALSENNLLELLYQNKWSNIVDCKIQNEKFAQQYNDLVTVNRDQFELLDTTDHEIDQDLYDQNNRLFWYMPQEYKQFDIEDYVLGLCETSEQKQRVDYEITLYKSHAMMDVLQFLKYMVDTLRKNNIVWGVGRGSSVASYVLYLLGVHKVDSIKYNLDPTEFLR